MNNTGSTWETLILLALIALVGWALKKTGKP